MTLFEKIFEKILYFMVAGIVGASVFIIGCFVYTHILLLFI